MSYEKAVSDHYRTQAQNVGLGSGSTMPDIVIREKEIAAIFHTLSALHGNTKDIVILEIGCGNGVLLDELHKRGYTNVTGMDYLPEFVELAKSRKLPYTVVQGDVRKLDFKDGTFDVVIAERVIINLKDPGHQRAAYAEVRRVTKKGGHAIVLEGFEKALLNMNEARKEFGLSEIPMPSQNRWYKEGELEEWIKGKFEIVTSANGEKLTPRHFLSSHYFMSRVVHAMFTHLRQNCPDGFKPEERNSHFAHFFGRIMEPHGEYGPVQYVCMKAI